MKFALFTTLDSNENNDHIFSVFKSLDKHQLDYDVDSQSFDLISKLDNYNGDFNFSKVEKLSNEYDFVISIGGDGTILRSANEIGELSIPIIGLNKGRLGFLANSPIEIIDSIIDKIKNSNYRISERTIIQVEFEGKTKNALNEISISRKNTTSLITIDTKLNDQYLSLSQNEFNLYFENTEQNVAIDNKSDNDNICDEYINKYEDTELLEDVYCYSSDEN